MITIAHLRALLDRALTHTANPAILRLPEAERTVEGLIIAYLGEEVWTIMEWADVDDVRATISSMAWRSRSAPFRSRALLVALALALGLDPGVGGLGVSWTKRENGGYILCSRSGNRTFEIIALDDMAGLALAVAHVLEAAP
jgi:hypothetical protein